MESYAMSDHHLKFKEFGFDFDAKGWLATRCDNDYRPLIDDPPNVFLIAPSELIEEARYLRGKILTFHAESNSCWRTY
jgi:hypothetical protein